MSRVVDGAPWPTGATRPVVLLGWPVRHSLSPELHNAAFREHGLDLVYLALPVRPEQLLDVVAALGAVGTVGANVTVPHKRAVVAACDHLTDEAAAIGAVNTLVWTTDGLLGDNTDATGLRDALRTDVGIEPGTRFVLLGTGGAARAAAVAVARLGGELSVVGRRSEAAQELTGLAERTGASASPAVTVDDDAALAEAVAAARVVVNATPLGMQGEHLPAPFEHLRDDQVAYDLVYDPPNTPFLQAANAAGAESHHGIGMLIGQAAASYRRWTGRPAPAATLSAVAAAALSERRRVG